MTKNESIRECNKVREMLLPTPHADYADFLLSSLLMLDDVGVVFCK